VLPYFTGKTVEFLFAVVPQTDPKLLGAILRAAADMISAPAGTSIH